MNFAGMILEEVIRHAENQSIKRRTIDIQTR
jgi:hypothetical protein